MSSRRGLPILFALLLAQILTAQVSFDFTYQDVIVGSGIGFDDPLHGATRRDALQQAGDAVFGSLFDHDTVVEILVQPSTLNGGDTLANAGSSYFAIENSFLVDSSGTGLIDPNSHGFQVPASTLTNGVWFNGPNAVLANGGNPVRVYTPSTFSSGSSLSHLDPSLGDFVSLPSFATGDVRRELSPIELGIFADLGYQIDSPVPEPGTGLLLAGLFAAVGLRRRSCPRHS